MVIIIFIKEKKTVSIKPMRIQAIQKLKLPTSPKGCRSFAAVANSLVIFCLELQKLLKPIYDPKKKKKKYFIGKMTTKSI